MATRRKNPRPDKKPKKRSNARSRSKQGQQSVKTSRDEERVYKSLADAYEAEKPENIASLFFLAPPKGQPDQPKKNGARTSRLAWEKRPASHQLKQQRLWRDMWMWLRRALGMRR